MELLYTAGMVFFAVFLLNANPIFTIPTWIVVALSIGKADPISMLPVILVGISASAIGRYVLTRYSKTIGERIIPKRQKRNMEFLKEFFMSDGNSFTVFILAFIYALSPLPTNALFLIAGIANLRVIVLLAGFFVGELLSNLVYITVLESAMEEITLSTGQYILMGAVGIFVTVAILLIDWKKIIKELVKRELEQKSYRAVAKMYEKEEGSK